ncbi:hypothetical protein NKG94_38725 [Micromonospora sp. M12]
MLGRDALPPHRGQHRDRVRRLPGRLAPPPATQAVVKLLLRATETYVR